MSDQPYGRARGPGAANRGPVTAPPWFTITIQGERTFLYWQKHGKQRPVRAGCVIVMLLKWERENGYEPSSLR